MGPLLLNIQATAFQDRSGPGVNEHHTHKKNLQKEHLPDGYKEMG